MPMLATIVNLNLVLLASTLLTCVVRALQSPCWLIWTKQIRTSGAFRTRDFCVTAPTWHVCFHLLVHPRWSKDWPLWTTNVIAWSQTEDCAPSALWNPASLRLVWAASPHQRISRIYQAHQMLVLEPGQKFRLHDEIVPRDLRNVSGGLFDRHHCAIRKCAFEYQAMLKVEYSIKFFHRPRRLRPPLVQCRSWTNSRAAVNALREAEDACTTSLTKHLLRSCDWWTLIRRWHCKVSNSFSTTINLRCVFHWRNWREIAGS